MEPWSADAAAERFLAMLESLIDPEDIDCNTTSFSAGDRA